MACCTTFYFSMLVSLFKPCSKFWNVLGFVSIFQESQDIKCNKSSHATFKLSDCNDDHIPLAFLTTRQIYSHMLHPLPHMEVLGHDINNLIIEIEYQFQLVLNHENAVRYASGIDLSLNCNYKLPEDFYSSKRM